MLGRHQRVRDADADIAAIPVTDPRWCDHQCSKCGTEQPGTGQSKTENQASVSHEMSPTLIPPMTNNPGTATTSR